MKILKAEIERAAAWRDKSGLTMQQLAELTLEQGMSGYILSVRSDDEVRRFAEEVAPAVPELVETERGRMADELIDALVVRPGAWFGRFAQNTFERVIVNGLLIGGSTGLVRAGSALVRGTQSGILRVYAGLMLVGIAGVGLYFLLQS